MAEPELPVRPVRFPDAHVDDASDAPASRRPRDSWAWRLWATYRRVAQCRCWRTAQRAPLLDQLGRPPDDFQVRSQNPRLRRLAGVGSAAGTEVPRAGDLLGGQGRVAPNCWSLSVGAPFQDHPEEACR